MCAVRGIVCLLFKFLLELHHCKRICFYCLLVAQHIGREFHHHAAVGPPGSAVAWAHSVDHDLLLIGGCRDHETARAHAEGIDAESSAFDLHLGGKGILCGRKIFASSLRVVVLDLVYQVLGMLESYSHGKALGLDVDCLAVQHAEGIPCCVADCKNHGAVELNFFACFCVLCDNAGALVFFYDQVRDLGLEAHLPAVRDYRVAHGLDYLGKLVGSDVRMGIVEDGLGGSELDERCKDLGVLPSLLASGVELAVGIGSGPALAEAVVGFAVHDVLRGDLCNVLSS